MREAGFVHLHTHTEYSLLDGASRIKPLVKLAEDYRFPALAITDHGNLFGAIEFFKAAQKAGVKPIIGCECYIAPRSRTDKTMNADVPESSFHLTLLCESLEGYHNLIRLVSLGFLEGFYYRPRIDKEILAQHHKGLIAMSACLKGEVNYLLNHGEYEKAKNAAAELQSIMGKDSFFLEVMRIGLPETQKIEPGIERIGKELGIPLVATNDSHYLRRGDHEAHDALVCLGTGKRVKDKARMKFDTQEVYVKSAEEMIQLFADKPELIRNTLEISSRCNVMLEAGGKHFQLPVFPRPPEYETDYAYLLKLAREGLTRRFGTPTGQQQDRLEHELGVIHKMGFAGYFLIVKDITDHARREGISVGPGRGSAVGSLVLYALGITDVDPVRYGLIFERFLTTERVTLPDIDVDFADNRRAEVIAYIRQRYGEDCVAQIITFGTMQSRAAVRDVGRVLDIPLPEVDRLAKLIPFNETLPAALKGSNELRTLVNSRPEYQKLFEIAQRVEGISRHASIHASGVVITPKALIGSVPLYKTSDGDICTQYDMNSLEAIGLLKMDVLGLRTLTVIDKAQKLLETEGIRFDKENVPLDDPKTLDLLRKSEVVGIFQLESAGMQNLLVRTQPENLEDIMAVISLYRPGPMGNVDLTAYIDRKKGKIHTKLMHPALDEVLKDTHGVIIYQEQVMKIANMVAGFSLAEADKLRRVMGKKIAEEMGPMREKFMAGAKQEHVTPKIAGAIFDLIEPFAGYGFNKSHAAGYAVLSYLTAYLKANYPVEFMTATLVSDMGNSDKLRKFIAEVRRMQIPLLGPDVNQSDYPFTIEEVPILETRVSSPEPENPPLTDTRNRGSEAGIRDPGPESPSSPLRTPRSAPMLRGIRFGLGGIKNLGQGVCESIVKERAGKPYGSFTDFIKRTRAFTNRKADESLVMAGAFDAFNPSRQELLDILPKEIEKATSARAAMLDRQVSLFGDELPPDGHGRDPVVSNGKPAPAGPVQNPHHGFEKSSLGFYLSSHPLEDFEHEMKALKCTALESLAASSDERRAPNEVIVIAGVIADRKLKKDKNGSDYAILQLEDLTGSTEVMVFNKTLESCRKLARVDELVIVLGKMRMRGEGQASIWADALLSLKESRNFLKALSIRVRPDGIEDASSLPTRKFLEGFPGNADVFFIITEDGEDRRIRIRDLKVLPSTELVQRLQALPWVQAVRVNGALPLRDLIPAPTYKSRPPA
jgi:DNA polymerase III subunit alpha